ncbi:hypothetical protein B296_00014544 [Ensete ventricosum]|uniref:Uncharacterized protein n=1 Tax=Ensete ventricosum TaxID=4639 RepID=A0A426YEL3_ENSVE|nr:hypothetical protein B296_00014544 [Ensete ventricosum]
MAREERTEEEGLVAEATDLTAEGTVALVVRCRELADRKQQDLMWAEGEGCDSDRRGVEEDELLARAKAIEAEDVDVEGYLRQRGEATKLLLRCGRRCRAGPKSSYPRTRTVLAIGNVVVEAGTRGSRQLHSSSRGSWLRLKKRVATVAEEERRELMFDSNRK